MENKIPTENERKIDDSEYSEAFGDSPTSENPSENAPKPQGVDPQSAIEMLAQVVDGIDTGAIIIISRHIPAYCSGWLETINVSRDNPLTMEYLAETWGGEALNLQLRQGSKYVTQTRVTLRSYPPKHKGVIIRPPSRAEILEFYGSGGQPRRSSKKEEPGFQIRDLFELMQKQRKDDLSMIRQMIEQRTPAAPVQQSSMRELIASAKDFSTLKDALGESGGGDRRDNSEINPLESLEKMVGMYLKTKALSAQSSSKRREQALTGEKQAKEEPSEQPSTQQKQLSIVNDLANMDPTTAAETVLGAFGKMPDDKRALVIDQVYDIFEGDADDEPNELGAPEEPENGDTKGIV